MSPDEFTPNPTPPNVAPPRRPPRFDAEPFRPDGVVPTLGLILLLGGVLLTAVALGCLLGFVGQRLYLVIFFPLLAGLLLGAVGRGLVHVGKVRSPVVAGIVAAIGGVAMMLSMHYYEYVRDLNNPAWRGRPPADVFDYIDAEARRGVVIGEVGGVNGMNIGYIGSYVYFAVETAIAAAFAFAVARGAAVMPFCTNCGSWMKPRQLAALPYVQPSAAVEALRAGAFLELLASGMPHLSGRGLKLKAFFCQRCGGDGTVVAVVQQVTPQANGRSTVKVIGQYVYPGEVLALLNEHLPRRPAPRRPGPAGRPAGQNPPGNRSDDIRPGP